ncbi:MAG TPA: VCBS repeat-containing protein [Opitutaceae bacterium]|nr:VCBS repeat-containing protein [Opitutaceae bacterium]
MKRFVLPIFFALLIVAGLAWFVRHRGSSGASTNKLSLNETSFVPRAIGRPIEGQPRITDLTIADLDGDGWKDVIACDGRLNQIVWLRQTSRGVFAEQDIGGPVAGPAHVEVVDFDGDGHLDVLVASMGVIMPSNAKSGAVVVLLNDGTNHFTNRVLLENVARVTFVSAADFNGDGRLDLVVGQFGYIEGEIRWMENKGDWKFESHSLLDLPGTIHAPAADFSGSGHPDIAALVSQDSEEVHLFTNDGKGNFRDRILWGSTNKDYGSSGLSVADLNQDGRPDLLYTNGDGFDYATPGSRPWHGVQWLENLGGGKFAFHRIGDFPGCYSPLAVDLDKDGDLDVVTCSGFNDWSSPAAVSLMVFENRGGGTFVPRALAHAPTHLIVVKAADLYNDGELELVTGSFVFYPPYDRAARITLWQRGK